MSMMDKEEGAPITGLKLEYRHDREIDGLERFPLGGKVLIVIRPILAIIKVSSPCH